MTPTEPLKEILNDESFCIAMATYKEPFNAALYQIQMSMTTEENRDSVGSTILALKNIHGIFHDIILKGEALIAKKEKSTTK
jgi:hypothetical protein